jgi:hypothetical protein|nr:MAG TPA: Type I restriction enzyme [Caudoviricetes sp.]
MGQNDKNLRGIYNTLKKEGYTPPEYETFVKDMREDKNLQGVRNTLVRHGYNPPEFAEFKADMLETPTNVGSVSGVLMDSSMQTPDEKEPPQAAKEWSPTTSRKEQESRRITGLLDDFDRVSKEHTDNVRRKVESLGADGREKLKNARERTRLMGMPTRVAGIAPSPVPTSESVPGKSSEDAGAVQNSQSPVPYGIRYIDGKFVTEWLLPDGSVTVDAIEADQAEYGARTARLQREFENRMKQNGLDPAKPEDVEMQAQYDAQAPAYDAVAELWQEAEEKHKADKERNAKKHWDSYAAMGGGREMRIVTTSMNRHDDNISHMTRFDLQKMMDNAWNRVGSKVTTNCYNRLRQQYPGASEEELQATASQMARQLTDNAVYQYAVQQNTPKSTLEYFGRTVADMNVINSISKGLARSQAGTSGDLAAYEAAMGEYGKNHRVAQIAGTVTGMAVDPVTWVSGGVGSLAGKGAINLGGRFIAGRAATSMSTQVGSRLFSSSLTGRIITGAAAGGGNFATYEMLKEGESQFLHGGHINPETGENEGYSAGAVLSAGGHGLVLGSVTGTLSPVIGNVADKTVKATTSTAGKAGVRFGEVAVSTLAEGTIFSVPEWITGDADAMDVWTDNLAMMLGFKAQHGLKSAPRVIASLRPVKPVDGRPLTQAERNHNRMDFEERLRRNLDASQGDLSFTSDEREELRRAGYGELADLFSRDRVQEVQRPDIDPAEGAIELRAERVEAETISRNPEFDGYSSMEELMQDGRVSQSARAKAYYILTGRRLPMASVTGYTTTTDADGRVTVNSMAADGEVVTSRTFKNEQEAKQETDNIMRQAELNSVDIGERFKEAVADDMVLDAAISEVSPGADPATIKRIYRAVKAGNKDVTESQRQLVEFLDDAIERNRDIADRYRPEAIREVLKEETGTDVDAVLRKMPSKRTEAEQAVVKSYLERLFPEEARQQAAEPTPEQAEAQSQYEQGRELYGRFEEGDPTVQADVDAIALRMQEAYQAVEDAFGSEAEYYMFHVNENPWALVDDPELTVEQKDAVLYYINAKAALDGVMDASNEVADRKRAEVEESVAKRTHKDNGVIIPATMKVDDRPVYIVKGDVVMFPDGSAVDVHNSSESVVVMDAQTGEYKFTSPDQIFQVSEAVNPQDELDTALSVIEQEQMNIFGDNAVAPEDSATDAEAPQQDDIAPLAQPAEAEAPATADTEAYDRGYEQGIAATNYTDKELAEAIEASRSYLNEGSLDDFGRGRLEGLEYEQQRRAMEAQSVPETPESVPNPAENPVSDAEIAPETVPSAESGQQTALSRIPINEQGEPRFEAVDKDTAWGGLVEAVGGEADAVDIAMAQVQQATSDLEALKKKPPTQKAPKLKGSPMAMAQAKREAAEQYQHELVQYNQQIADTQARLDAWNGIIGVYTSRNAELRRQQEEERRQRDTIAYDEAVARFEEEQRIKADKQAEQERIGVHAVNPKIKDKWDAAPKVEGNADAITLPDGSTLTGRYVLTEAGAASPSHDVNNAYQPTEGFPIDENGQSVNDRDYMRDKDAQQIVEGMASSYDNRALQDPVIVSRDGVVLSGNNRTMSGDLAAGIGTDKAYVDYLAQFGHKKFGFTPEQVAGMKNPRVVFVPDEALPYDATTFARFNAQEKKSQGKPEAAVKLGKIVPDNVFNSIVNDISRYDRLPDYYANEKAVAQALGALMQAGVINDKQLPEMRTGTALSATGKELIENTLIGKVFQASPDAVRQIISVPTLRQSIVMGLSEIANNRTLSRNGYDISDELAKAVDLVARAKTAMPDVYTDGMPVSPFGRMQGLFDDEFGDSRITDATALLLADILNSGKPSDLRKVLTSYNNEAAQASGGQIDIFSGSIPSKEEILTTVNEHFRNATPKEQQALVDAAIAERKRRAEADAEQRERSEASEQTPHDDERGAESQQPVAGDTEFTELEPLGNDLYEDTPEEAALRARISVGEEWEEEGPAPDKSIYKRKLYVDGKHEVIQTDAPDKNDSYTGSQLTFDSHDFGDLKEIADYIDGGMQAQQAEPTEAQKAAGNYKMEHRRVDGYNISIENAKGSVRRGTGADGKPWETVMQNDYGYIRGTEGVDGDHIDVFLSDTPEEGDVFVVDQVNEDGSFDEHKVMYGFPSEEAAREAYLSNYEQGWTGLGAITHVSKEEFKKWIGSSKRKTKPFAEYKSVKPIEDNSMVGRSLSEQEATDLIARMEVNAEVAPAIELTPENWIAQFGEDGTVDTPLGTVKMGANQLLKLYSLKRTEYFGMIHPTLNSPDVIMEKHAPADGAERDSKYLFVKTFIKSDGSRLVHFESVTVKRDGMEVSISSHEAEGKAIKKEMQNSKILHLSESLSLSSERYLTEAPTETEGPDLVPTSDNVISSDGKVNTFSAKNQINRGPSDFVDKSADKQAESAESSLQSKATQSVTESDNPQFSEGESAQDAIRYRFTGETGALRLDKAMSATWRLDNLGIARKMESSGKSAKEIKIATGWERGADRKWRYEEPDGEYIPPKDNKSEVRLSDIWHDDNLYISYPALKDTKVKYVFMPETRYVGWCNPKENKILINRARSGNTKKNIRLTLVHEIQHAIQHEEHFAFGSSPENAFEAIMGLELSDFDGSQLRWLSSYRRRADELVRKGKYKRLYYAIKNVLKEAKNNNLYPFENYDKRDDVQWTVENAVLNFSADQLEKAAYFDRMDAYKRIAGEVEARNVQKRINYKDKTRRTLLAEATEDVAREDQIFLETAFRGDGDMGYANIPTGEDGNKYREGEALSEGERLRAIHALEPIEVKRNEMSKAELFSEYRALPDVIKDGSKIQFLRTAFGKNYKQGGLFAQVVPQLDELLSTSVLAYSESDSLGGTLHVDGTEHKVHPNVSSFDNYVNKARIDDQDYYVRMTVQKTIDNTTGVHSCFVSNVDVYEKPVTGETDSAILRRPKLPYDGIVDAKLQQFFERASSEANILNMRDRVKELSEKSDIHVRVITDESELTKMSEDGKPRYSRRERRAKGWWSAKDDEVVIVLPNNRDVADVDNTFVHEVVGHKGLRALVGEERFDEFLGEVYDHASNPIRKVIDKMTDKMVNEEADRLRVRKAQAHERSVEDVNANYYTDMAEACVEAEKKREEFRKEATEEYMSDLGGRIGSEGFEKMSRDELTLWGKIKAKVQAFLDKFLQGLKITKSIRLNDKDLSYILYKSWKNLHKKGVFADAEDAVMRRRTGYDADEVTRFRDPGLGLEETITKMKAEAMQANAGNLQAKRDVMRAIGGNLNHLRQAMARQREYDITTVKSVADLARVLMDNNLLDDLSKYETKRILGAINNVVGKQDVSQYVQKVMDIMVDNQLRMGANTLGRLLSIRGSRVDARGIKVQGELDPDGQRIAQVVRKSTSLPKDDIDNRIAEAINRMSSTDQAIADEATIEYAGLQIARQYVEDITESKAEEKALRDSIREAKEAKDAGQMTEDAYRQYVESTEDAIRQNKIERAEAFHSLVEQVGGVLSESVERAKAWREAEKQRVEEIHHNANSDMEGRPTDEHHKDDRMQKMVNNSFARFLLSPLATFDQMLRMFGKKNSRGEGYLWNRYMRDWVTATEKEYTGYRDALKALDAKVSEIYGKDMTWGDLFTIDRKLPKASVRFFDGGEMKDHELTQGNLLYIYMADNMSDGRMKLRRMGITEEDIEDIKNFLDPKFMQLADWMQEEFLVDKRNEYNEVHKRMFGASMAAIENYFPLKILANARLEDVDVADDTTDTALPATSTGSIIKRRRNNLALDVTGANAFSVILDHLQQMERWAAFAEFNRDLNTLLSYKRFRNQVMNMSSVYGAGKTLWKNFRNVCSMAAGAYRPPIAALDKSAVNIAKGVTAAKVSFRVFTALKQFLSMPAYASDSNPLYLAANIANPIGAWRWSMKNLPLFEKRWRSRMAGDPRLLKSEMDWKMWRSRVVELASRVGMAPNAFVDALTVAIGAHAMYQTKLAKYKRQGYDPDVAEERAKQDATILFNQTQQSSEGAFLSTMQVDRSWLSVLFTVFRNSSMSYTRQLYDSIRNIGRRLTPGYKSLSEEFMAKQMRRDGIDPDKADRNAKQEYRRGIIRDLVRVGIFGYVLQLAWNMGAYLPYLIFGNDDDEKDKMLDDVFTHTMFGSIEGLTGGDVYSNTLNAWAKGEKITPWVASKDMPLSSDLENIWTKWNTDEISAMNDVINLLVQSAVGVNPQSLTDAVVAVMDVCGDDAQTSRECALLMARVINCPQSQLDKIYFDELGATGEEASQMTPYEIAERYARYKVRRGAPMIGWAYGNEQREKIMDKYRKKSNTLAKERLTRETDTQASPNMTQWLEEFEATKDHVRDIKKVKSRDEDRYYELLDELEATPEFSRYEIIRAYKHDVDELTKEWLNATTPAQRDSCAQAILTLKRDMVRELSDTQQ